ncbi:unnamed protein product (macronuclear) [Paramecium tetraurelia]|uniref:Calpain catalytic domain-containing protein n=1 Tax=Paramecium tetraurelia TaxID=5888 RepID=A0BM88_PARTE|nr:uncharacterized protein GSPATT00030291001 [Paramecium tetraurelia]CAK59655.1 unnamed protein product [Paramecium tetraurelia]|eukprot:XP_001427053.1 hypothetical protein (macronuclear) [Paramecium tetraurelia strain d4-2]
MGCIINYKESLNVTIPRQPLQEEPYKNNHFRNAKLIYNEQEYTDEVFQRININLSKDPCRFEALKNYQWKRIAKSNINQNLCREFQYLQIIKGELKNDQFLNALRILSFYDVTIRKIFLIKQIQSNCQYRIVLNQQGFWQEIVIDDYLPFNMSGKPLFSFYDGEDYWVQLIEKAFSKIYGCYEKLEQVDMANEIIRDITGAPYLVLDEQEFNHQVSNYVNLQNVFYLMDEKKDIFLMQRHEESNYFLDLQRKVKLIINDFSNYKLFFIPFDEYYIQITQQIEIPIKNQQVKQVIQMTIQQQCHAFITVSQQDLKVCNQNYYAQLHITIVEDNKNRKNFKFIHSKYQQVRDLTIECNLAIGSYLIYIEAFWQSQTNYKLNIQSYGNCQVYFTQLSKMRENEKLDLLNEIIYSHSKSQNKRIYGNDQLYSVQSQIGRYKYILFENNTLNQTLKVFFKLMKHLVIVNFPYNDQSNQLIQVLPNERKLVSFQILLENEDKHNFSVEEENFEILGPLTDYQLIEKAINEPTSIIQRNEYMKIYNLRLDDEYALVYVNNSEQNQINKFKLQREPKPSTIQCRGITKTTKVVTILQT